MDEIEENDVEAEWAGLGVHAWAIDSWREAGFSPFEAALAQGDGFTPMAAAYDRRKLQKTADSWRRVGKTPSQALQLHRSGQGARRYAKQRLGRSSREPSSDSCTSRSEEEATKK